MPTQRPPDLRVEIGRLSLQNPVMTASGTFGYGREFKDLVDLNRLGAIIVKGLSLAPSRGNPPPRIAETPCGMLNAIGLENVGIEAFKRDKLPFLRQLSVPVLANIYGTTVDAYAELAAQLDGLPEVAGIEVNISCPNVTDVTEIARSAEGAGADALSLINTITGMAVDIHTRRPKLANITGGLSGPAIRPVAVRMVWQVARAVKIPVIGIGGIMTAEDALEFLIAGAAAVQVGTANFVNPRATMEILAGIEAYLVAHRFSRLTDLIGSLEA
jgi:dihydroorotate dehydrogenase (NAD+) catalytic subunit